MAYLFYSSNNLLYKYTNILNLGKGFIFNIIIIKIIMSKLFLLGISVFIHIHLNNILNTTLAIKIMDDLNRICLYYKYVIQAWNLWNKHVEVINMNSFNTIEDIKRYIDDLKVMETDQKLDLVQRQHIAKAVSTYTALYEEAQKGKISADELHENISSYMYMMQ